MEIPIIQPAAITTQPPGVSWMMSNVPPAGDYYISRDDQFYIRSMGSVAGLTVQIRARILLSNGQLVTFEADHIPASNRTVTTQIIQIAEGFLLDCTAFVTGATVKRGQLYVNIGLCRSTTTDFTPVQSFIANYLQSPGALAFPGSPQLSSIEGPGVIRSITGTDPAPGVEISETVPAGAKWRLVALLASLTTSAVVANRIVAFVCDDGANPYSNLSANTTQAASLTIRYNYGAYPFAGGLGFINSTTASADPLIIPAGHRIRTLTANLDAGDNWTAPQYLVEEWLEN